MNKFKSEGNLVKNYKLGNTKVKIWDTGYRQRSEQSIKSVLENIIRIGNIGYQNEVLRNNNLDLN